MDSLSNPDASENVITWMKDGSEILTSFDGQTQISFPNPIQTSDQGIYEIYYDNERHQSRGGLYRLIVRECPAGKWGPPECYAICDKCYNGGICDDKSGLCICPNNFKGPNCLEICRTDGGNRFGLNLCTIGTYGPGCSQTCHCAGGSSCDRYSGICIGGCQTGWSGDNCQKCEGGTFGVDCVQQCHCAPEACETERGLCKGQCLDSWIGPYCSQRISRLVPVRVNPYQPASFTCYVEGIPLPDASSVDLYRRTEDTNNRTGITRISSTVLGSERAVVFDAYSQEDGEYVCVLCVGNVSYPSTPVANANYGEQTA
eukprot:XP_011682924.1 PREDICTED: multiple epidermal growth factor-like domains protein 6 [Strongylocentrotus purpuratus]